MKSDCEVKSLFKQSTTRLSGFTEIEIVYEFTIHLCKEYSYICNM
jgi:hypothetical protein